MRRNAQDEVMRCRISFFLKTIFCFSERVVHWNPTTNANKVKLKFRKTVRELDWIRTYDPTSVKRVIYH